METGFSQIQSHTPIINADYALHTTCSHVVILQLINSLLSNFFEKPCTQLEPPLVME